MKINKKKIIGTFAVAGLTTLALVSCGKKNDDTKTPDTPVETQEYTLTLDKGDGQSLSAETITVTDLSDMLAKLGEITGVKEHYELDWFKAVLKDSQKIDVTEIDNFADVDYIEATWKKATYEVTLDYKGNASEYGASGTKDDTATKSVKYLDNLTEAAAVVKLNGYNENGSPMTFAGWYTDKDYTTAYDYTTEVTGNFTLYAKWEIKTISTADEFLDYISQEQTINAEIAKDAVLDFTGKEVTRDANTVGMNDAKDTYTLKMSTVISGNGATIKNLNITSSVKAGLFGNITGSITDLTFKDCKLTTSQQNAGFLALNADGAVLEDLTFDNVVVENTAAKNNNAIVVCQIKGSKKVSFDGIVIKNSKVNASQGDYNAGLIAIIDGAASSVSITDCVIDAEIVGKSQGFGLVIGQITSNATEATVSIDGLVLSGTITGQKNIGGIIGDRRKENLGKISIKNVFVTDFTATASSTSNAVHVLIGSDNQSGVKKSDTVTVEKVYIRKYTVSAKNTEGVTSGLWDTDGVALSDVPAALTKNIAIDATNKKVTLDGNDAFEFTADPAVEAVKSGTVAVTGATYTAEGTKITGQVKYYSKAVLTATYSSNLDAGNYFVATITPDASITNTTGYIISGDDAYSTLSENKVIALVKVTKEELEAAKTAGTATITKTVDVVWYLNETKVAATDTYTFNIDVANTTLEGYTPSYGTLNDTTVETETYDAEKHTLTYAANTIIAYNAEKKGNYTTIEITLPEAYSSVSSIIVGKETVTVTAGKATASVKLTGASTTLSVQWNETLDPVEYTITGYKLEAAPADALVDVTYKMSDYTKEATSSEVALVDGKLVAGEKVVIDGNKKSYDGVEYTSRAKMGTTISGKGYLKVTVDGNCTVTILAINGNGSDTTRTLTVLNSEQSAIYTSNSALSGSSLEAHTVTLTGAQTITIGSTIGAINIYAIIVTYIK